MTNKTNNILLLPERWHVLSGSWLKIIAMALMLIDHVASQILRYYPAFTEPLITLGNHHITWYYLLRCVGRLAFPIFCFLLVEGFQHTHDRWKYGRNLFVFALISEIPYNLTHGGHIYGWSQNVFFTLFLGFLALCVVRRWEDAPIKRNVMTCPLCPLTAYLLLLTAYGYEMKASRWRGLLSFIAGVGYDVSHLSGKPVSRKLVLITGIGQTPERNCAKLPKRNTTKWWA